MAICQAEGDRRRTRWGRSAAEDGGVETFLAREEWAKPRGRKSQTAIAYRRSRRSRPLARSSHQRPCCSWVRQPSKEKTWRISRHRHKRPGALGEGKEIPACRWVAARIPEPDERQRSEPPGLRRTRRGRRQDQSDRGRRRVMRGDRTERLGGPPPSHQWRGLTPLWSAAQAHEAMSGRQQAPCPASGAGKNAMRIHAVAATTAAPANAMASRQPSAGIAICASPRAA